VYQIIKNIHKDQSIRQSACYLAIYEITIMFKLLYREDKVMLVAIEEVI